ncbi:MAG: hypothetical protein ACYDA2_02825 [Acidimicrobiales bacterium]
MLAALAALSGCTSAGHSGSPAGTGAHGGSASVGSSSGRGAGSAPVGPGAVGSGAKTSGGAGAGSSSSGAGAAGAGGTGTSSPAASSAAAQQALSNYLQAIVHHNGSAVQSSSDGAALGVAGILVDVAAIDTARGATTTVTLGQDTFAPTGTSASSVTFGGSVSLTTAVSGPKGSGQYTDTLSGPVTVADEAGTWRVTTFTYDAKPIAIWPETANQTVNGLHLSVGYVVSFGDLTAVLIGIGQISGNVNVQLQSTTLTAGTTDSGVGDFTGPPQPTGVLRFTRSGSPPTQLTVDFTGPNGQQDDFTLALS